MSNILKLPSAEQIDDLLVQNKELINGRINSKGLVLENNNKNTKGILIGVNNTFDTELEVAFEMSKDGIDWFKWFDGFGDEVKLVVGNGNNIYGPIHGFPYLNYSKLLIDNINDLEGSLQEVSYGLPIENISSSQLHPSGQTPDYAFNHQTYNASEDGCYLTLSSSGSYTTYIQIKLLDNEVVTKLSMWGRSGSTTLKDFIVKGSNDGVYFDELFTGTLQRNGTTQEFDIPNTNHYLYYRIDCINNYGFTAVSLQDIRMFTPDISIPVFIQGIL